MLPIQPASTSSSRLTMSPMEQASIPGVRELLAQGDLPVAAISSNRKSTFIPPGKPSLSSPSGGAPTPASASSFPPPRPQGGSMRPESRDTSKGPIVSSSKAVSRAVASQSFPASSSSPSAAYHPQPSSAPTLANPEPHSTRLTSPITILDSPRLKNQPMGSGPPRIPTCGTLEAIIHQWEYGHPDRDIKPLKDWGDNWVRCSSTWSTRRLIALG